MGDVETVLVSAAGGVMINGGPRLYGRLEMTRELVEVTSETKPDLQWEMVDNTGHFHAYDADGELPTLRDEGNGSPEYRCRICEQVIQPRRLPGPGVKTVYGRQSWQVFVSTRELLTGLVSVRCVMEGRTWFGVAHAYLDKAEDDSRGGVRLRMRLSGLGRLGVR